MDTGGREKRGAKKENGEYLEWEKGRGDAMKGRKRRDARK